MYGHIATTDTFFIDAPIMNLKCPICEKECKNELGYIGLRCSNCKSVYDLDWTMPDIARRRRELMKFNRSQMAEITGYAKSSIKKYEFVRCTQQYFDKTTELIKKHLT